MDVVIFLWLLRVVPSVSYPLRRLLPGALFGAAGFEVLKLLGGYYLSLISGSVTASAFGGAVGLLVWINLVARFAFFTAAWTATLRRVEAAPPAAGDADRSPAAARRPADRRSRASDDEDRRRRPGRRDQRRAVPTGRRRRRPRRGDGRAVAARATGVGAALGHLAGCDEGADALGAGRDGEAPVEQQGRLVGGAQRACSRCP